MAIQGKDVSSLLLSLALISCVANGADHLAPRRLLTNLCTFDVTRHGVKAGAGQCKQNAVALTKVWVQACQSVAPAKVLIPSGTFEMSPVVLEGPCKNPIIFEIQGTLKADTNKNAYTDLTWFAFEKIDGLQVTGKGTFDGQGPCFCVGSLGKYKDEKNVNKVLVTDCKFIGTDNGARIKTWLNSPNLKATDITFQNLVMDMVKNPIVIDQEYGTKSPVPSNILLSDIHFRNITGTSISDAAVNVVCSKKFPCCVDMANIDLVYKGTNKLPKKFECANAKLTFTGKQNPAPCPCRR
ncbi:hypothetical protein LWI29_021972 [Acer saccharum]|uniref:Polygalacturonase n=1 Tax=Acer saccharum TaxID=4024 RepID=A0AA39SJL0_ACESA|nr:hypothetical protein LWI29_021972 [Acer saccharum]